MKRHLIIFAALITLLFPAISGATSPHPGPYVSGFLGISVPRATNVSGYDYYTPTAFDEKVEFDPGINIGGTVGFDYGFVRLEGELSYKHGEIATITDQAGSYSYRSVDGTLGAAAMLFNAFFDLHNSSPVTPYLGGGVGFATLHLSDTYVSGDPFPVYQEDDDSVLAYQAGAGLEIALNRNFSLDLGYRYFGTTKARFDSSRDISADLKFRSHNTAIGFRVKF